MKVNAKPKSPLVTIRRIRITRYEGVAKAAELLGVSRQCVSNYLTGRRPSSLSASKAALIEVINK